MSSAAAMCLSDGIAGPAVEGSKADESSERFWIDLAEFWELCDQGCEERFSNAGDFAEPFGEILV
ncbi:MAG TPA: hypothetical protein VK968_02415, partial [Roseimicrobium sp.]|nr:hypothetical protein [Roseimicrobium sp.]